VRREHALTYVREPGDLLDQLGPANPAATAHAKGDPINLNHHAHNTNRPSTCGFDLKRLN
jgi:hypothetical protein